MKLKSKLFSSAVAFTMVLSMVAVPASAQTTAELTAQINSLLAMIAQLQAQLAAQGGSTAAGTTFTKDLTIGSTGAEVTALQQFLVAKGFLTMPAGVAYGYFGTLTKNALAAYQAANGISPAAGYFGPITRAKVNAAGTTTGGTTTGGTTTTGSITTPGAEGTITVTANNAGLVSTVYEGDDMAAVLGFNVEAKSSDIAVQRVKIDLGTNTKIYTKGYSKMYLTDGSNVLASSDLNSSTVVKDGTHYYITLAGFNYVVPKDSKKQLVLKADVMSAIDSTDRTTLNGLSINVPTNGVRGVDGAGIDQYGPASALSSRSVTFSAGLAETASLKIALNNATPAPQDVIAADGSSDNELDKLSLLTFDEKAEKDDVTMTDLVIDLVYSDPGGTATATTLYLFDGSTEVDSASVVATSDTAATATFSDIDFVVPKDTTKTFTIKADIDSANGTARTIAASLDAADVTAENTLGDSVTPTGSADGYTMSIRNEGVEITLVSKSISTNGVPQLNSTDTFSTSTLTATFNVKIKALGNDVVLGSVASNTPLFSSTTSFQLFLNGGASTYSIGTTTSFTIPSTCTTGSLTNSCTLAEGSEITVPVTFQIPGRNAASTALTSGLYSVELQRVNWGAAGSNTSTFMDGIQDWRTADVSFP